MNYDQFLHQKTQLGGFDGFDPIWLPDFLFSFQKALLEWAIKKGKAALFEDCGLGKSVQQLVYARNVFLKTRKPVLIACPLAVSYQTIREGQKFGIDCALSKSGKIADDITITNYENLHKFQSDDYSALIGDESSILKNFDSVTRVLVTEFMRRQSYRLLCTATAAPNDYIELGTTSEALGELGHLDMLTRFFKNEQNVIKPMIYRNRGKNFSVLNEGGKWRLKKHAEQPFWRWVCSWARSIKKPSDIGHEDGEFVLPPLVERQTVIQTDRSLPGELFPRAAIGLREQREERRLTLKERCEKVAELVDHKEPALV